MENPTKSNNLTARKPLVIGLCASLANGLRVAAVWLRGEYPSKKQSTKEEKALSQCCRGNFASSCLPWNICRKNSLRAV